MSAPAPNASNTAVRNLCDIVTPGPPEGGHYRKIITTDTTGRPLQRTLAEARCKVVSGFSRTSPDIGEIIRRYAIETRVRDDEQFASRNIRDVRRLTVELPDEPRLARCA